MILSNERAILAVLGYSEGTDREPEPYRVCFGFKHKIESFADHPAVTGEWKGEPLPDEMCRAAGFGPGCLSTAAGRFQFKKSTWLEAKAAIHAPDFSPESQDRAALWLIGQCGALTDVHNGLLAEAIFKMRRRWASLPGAGYSQPERRISNLAAAFTKAGGSLA